MKFGQSLRQALREAQPYVVGLGVPVILGILTVILPVQFIQGAQISSVSTKLDESEKRADLRYAFFDKSAEARTVRIEKKLDALDSRIRQRETEEHKLGERVAEMQVDPTRMLERVGIVPTSTYAAVSFNDQVYLLPRNKQSYEELIRRGYLAYQLSPILTGFMAAPAAAKASPK